MNVHANAKQLGSGLGQRTRVEPEPQLNGPCVNAALLLLLIDASHI